MSTHGPIEEETRQMMNEVAGLLAGCMPEGYGFALLTFRFGNHSDSRMNYISNAPREDMISALKELVANFEGRAHEAPGKQQ